MNLVTASLRRPYTVGVAVVALILLAGLAVRQMPRDFFPNLGVPVLYVAQPDGGMDPAQMEGYLTYYYEYHFLYITGIEHIESKSIQGAALLRLQFHPGTDMAQALAETIGYVNRARAFMPPGTVPPFVMRFDAGSVPVGNLVFRSDTHTVAELQDAALNRVRPLFATLPGVSAPPPFGGSARAIVVRVNPDRLRSYHLAPDDVVKAIASGNLVNPSGNVRMGDVNAMVPVNAVVKNIQDLGAIPIRAGQLPNVFVRDLATIEDASDIATGYALVNGRRTVYIPLTKRADASTLSVVQLVRENLPKFQAAVPDGMRVSYEFDQSPYVTRAMAGLLREALLGAGLTGLMVFLFLRDPRTVLIVTVNIPVSLLAASAGLWLTGQTINLMTLGGLALAVGILVDEATVTVENIHTRLAAGRTPAQAALEATLGTAVPRLLALLSVLAVFLPACFMTGAARALFLPLALSVGFAMAASYLLSTTLVPVLAAALLQGNKPKLLPPTPSLPVGHSGFPRIVDQLVRFRWLTSAIFFGLAGVLIYGVGGRLGTEIFPQVDSGQFQLRLHAPPGTWIERTEVLAKQVLDAIESEAGKTNVDLTLGFVGVQPPSFPVNTIHLWTSGPDEAVLQVQFKPGTTIKLDAFIERLRWRLASERPELSVSFEPSDLVSRVMSFGSPTPIEVSIGGPNLAANREYAEQVRNALRPIPELRDLQFQQSLEVPTINVTVNRERAGLLGLTVGDISRSLVPAVASSRFTSPVYWADPSSGVAYQIQVEVPQARMASLEDVRNVPVTGTGTEPVLLRSVADVQEGSAPGQFDRYNMQRQLSLTANLHGTDLGTAGRHIREALTQLPPPPARVTIQLRGQLAPLAEILDSLHGGLVLSMVAIFLLLTAAFQSIRLASVVFSTVPLVLAGVVCALAVSGTTLNMQSFMGGIMATGVAVANAILLVTASEDSRRSGLSPRAAAVEGVRARLRPILMTSLAMIGGMLPMALAWGDGGEQSAPLGRAVVGGLIAATLATLVLVPCTFAFATARWGSRSNSLDPTDPKSPRYVPQARTT